ncbi:hypothetical protein OHC33_004714 [Knufia fluminis]|uniref:DUF7918 domain-containing protein n=1 Tax=Knufia fluminis TaxID=191047 RepID=A0AAN8ING4_9EURO|nr:hypothetical protein OHC33_004714 [Knufia fluminis]
MPCFKGLAVSIHTPDGPLPEHSVQKVSRASRISTYIPVPPPRIPASGDATKAEQSTFAISITLLTPAQDVPYSTPKATPQNPHPKPRVVGALPGHGGDRGKYQSAVAPYVPLTTSPNETIAAYIYFDGRAKEEVATLLRRSEETWVNSRWVSVPDSEGGGLAEREFLFREVGIERWLNGLDLEGGQDAAVIIEKRRQKLERKRRKRKDTVVRDSDDEMEKEKDDRKKTLRYNANGDLQEVSDDDNSLEDSNTSNDDDPMPEAAGQIKIALFRVLASGEIKRGEYSPQFGAHDDDEEAGQKDTGKDIDHTTSFAKPKTLDPKTISTQTVTGIDPTDKPYATFTFFYRGERQLQKMGILEAPKTEKTPTSVKRRSGVPDLPSLGPLKKEGTVGFLNYRDTDATPSRRKASKSKPKKSADDMSDDESDDDPEVVGKMDDIDDTKVDPNHLSVEDAERTGQVSEGIRKMKLKRQHSAEPLNRPSANGSTEPMRKSSKGNSGTASPSAAGSPAVSGIDITGATSPNGTTTGANIFGSSGGATGAAAEVKKEDGFSVGSPFKRQRSSMADFDSGLKDRLAGSGLANASSSINELMSADPNTSAATTAATTTTTNDTTGATHNPEPAFTGIKFGGSLFKKQDENDDEL